MNQGIENIFIIFTERKHRRTLYREKKFKKMFDKQLNAIFTSNFVQFEFNEIENFIVI